MKILFLHGWHSSVGGVKPTYLKDAGHEVLNPKLDDDDFDSAVRTAQSEYDQHQPDVIVGSSRGGAVAMNIESGETPLVLLCPAWKNWGTTRTLKTNSAILHSRADDVIPFSDSEELIANSGLPPETLIEIGDDHRLADPEPLAMMLESSEETADKILGCDFGVPKRAGDQAKKNILIEATKVAERHYAIRPSGRNRRLLTWLSGERMWPIGRPGWTLPDLARSLGNDTSVRVVALDFPFGIPQTLLESDEFARVVGREKPFQNRDEWAAFVGSKLRLKFTSERANGEMKDLSNFDAWRTDSRFWHRRASDYAANGQPPLKHIGQNLFAMTIGGAKFLDELQRSGMTVVLDRFPSQRARSAFETYPSFVANRIGFDGSYKSQPVECLNQAISFLQECGIKLNFDPDVKRFCEIYRTGSKKDDPDGADAFLCLVAAICFNEGLREIIGGDTPDSQLRNEGGIIVPSHRQ